MTVQLTAIKSSSNACGLSMCACVCVVLHGSESKWSRSNPRFPAHVGQARPIHTFQKTQVREALYLCCYLYREQLGVWGWLYGDVIFVRGYLSFHVILFGLKRFSFEEGEHHCSTFVRYLHFNTTSPVSCQCVRFCEVLGCSWYKNCQPSVYYASQCVDMSQLLLLQKCNISNCLCFEVMPMHSDYLCYVHVSYVSNASRQCMFLQSSY